jgi:hypothetical protein
MQRRWQPIEAGDWPWHGQHTVICCPHSSGTDVQEGGIMLQASEIQKRFTHLQKTASEASQTCHAVATIPKDLMKWVDELDNECKSAKKVMSSKDEGRIRQWVDDLERIGDRAERACQQAGGLDARIMDAVSSMHSELSDLKRQLH